MSYGLAGVPLTGRSSYPAPVTSGDDAVNRRTSEMAAVVALRHSGLFTTRREVADKLLSQLHFKRFLRDAWLRNNSRVEQNMAAGYAAAAGLNAPDNGAHLASGLSASHLKQLVVQNRNFLSGNPVQLGALAYLPQRFSSRRHSAERLLAQYFGLSGVALDNEILAIAPPNSHGGSSGHGGADSQSGFGGQHGQGHHGQSGHHGSRQVDSQRASDSVVTVGAGENGIEAELPSARLRRYLIAEMAVSDVRLSPQQRAQAAAVKAQCFSSDASVLQAAQQLAEIAVEQASAPGGMNALPGAANDLSRFAPTGLRHPALSEVCSHLLMLYPADKLFDGLRTLINSVEVLGNRRALFGDGVALSDCLARLRNLSVISLIMDETARLKSVILLDHNARSFPPDASLWRAICRTTQGRSVDAIVAAIQEGDLSPASRRVLLQGIQTILRKLPRSVWADDESRAVVLQTLSEISTAVGAMRQTG